MAPSIKATIDLVLLGAGHAHVEVVRRLANRPEQRLRLTLITREPWTPYSGRVPAYIRGECAAAEAYIDLGPLSAAACTRLVLGAATAIDLAERRVSVSGRPALSFDLLSIDIGGIPAVPAGGGIPVKPIGGLLAELEQLNRTLAPGARIALIGGGASGAELALALARRFGSRFRIVLVCDTPDPLYHAPPVVRDIVRAALAETAVELACGVHAGPHVGGKLALSDGSFIDAAAVLWATQTIGPPVLAEAGLACDPSGCALVDPTLRSQSHGFVFAAGDCATIPDAPRPKAGVWALRAGPVLAANLRRVARGQPLRAWKPPADALAIVGLGDGRAVAWRGRLAVSGRSAARYKDWIDARFMRRYGIAGLPHRSVTTEVMPAELDPADLGTVSNTAGPHARAGLTPPVGAALMQLAVHLRAPLDDPFETGRIAAAQALVRLHASDARPWAASAIVTIPAMPDHHARADMLALLQGLSEMLAGDGAALVDCTSARGEALAIGLVMTGLLMAGHRQPVTLQAGNVLVLTKPPGSGIVLEGHRRGLAKARWLLTALGVMRGSSAAAAGILRQYGTTACTAVAIHGVIGTLSAMLRDANLAAVLYRDAVPALPGALELSALGVAHAASDDNRRVWQAAPDAPEIALLADPQIAGGLLAGVPRGEAEPCLAALTEAGYLAAAIGMVEPRRLEVPRMRLEAKPDPE
jgi:selenide, water dikinase